MHRPHPAAKLPAPHTAIWRYQDLAKCLSLLERRALFFARADRLGDPFEGAQTIGYLLQRELALQSLAKEHSQSTIDAARARWEASARQRREGVAVNCWHMATHESVAMWRLYCQTTQAVAIRSSVERLQSAVAASPLGVIVGSVNYSDYNDYKALPTDSPLYVFFHKHLSLSHEQELRAVVTAADVEDWSQLSDSEFADSGVLLSEGGVCVPVDVETLVERLYIAPTAPTWFERLVREVTKALGFEIPVQRSALDDPPIF